MAGCGRRLLEVILLVVAPVFAPCVWIGGAALIVTRQGIARRSLLTLALCPGGLLVPLWFYGAGSDPSSLTPLVAFPTAALLLVANLVAVWRLLTE